MKTIEFFSPLKGYIPEPKPALQFIPEAYKKMPGVIKQDVYSTVKKCIPFLDAFTSGYIIPFQTDIEYTYDEKIDQINFGIHRTIPGEFVDYLNVTSHAPVQISKDLMSPKRTIDSLFKFNNSWTVKTPPGYSCLFMTPFNHPLPFELVTGIVDTDSYDLPVNFPFYWTADSRKDFTLKVGTPWAMVFPFKREEWKMKINTISDSKMIKQRFYKLSFFSRIMDNYKRKAWHKKSFK